MDNEITSYSLVTAPSNGELNTVVNAMMRQGGWQPYGAAFHNGTVFAQTLVLYAEEEGFN